MKRANVLGAFLLLTGFVRGVPLLAQASVAANAGLLSSYAWRGVTYTNRFVVQPDISVTAPVRQASLTAGLWANIEPGRYDGGSDISESGGLDEFDVAEVNWFGEVGLPMTERAALALGATGYIFPNDDGLTGTSNSVELYGRAELTAPLNPTASLYYDIGKVKGAYLEAGISHPLVLGARTALTIGAAAGFSAGQDAELDADGEPQAESYNFEENGFTHADLWTSLDITAGAVTITPTVHVIVTGDEATKISKYVQDPSTGELEPNRTGAKLWFGVTLGWSR